jgi:hypothetical protein
MGRIFWRGRGGGKLVEGERREGERERRKVGERGEVYATKRVVNSRDASMNLSAGKYALLEP